MGHFLNADGSENFDCGIAHSSCPELGSFQHWQSRNWPATSCDQAIQNQPNILRKPPLHSIQLHHSSTLQQLQLSCSIPKVSTLSRDCQDSRFASDTSNPQCSTPLRHLQHLQSPRRRLTPRPHLPQRLTTSRRRQA